MTAPDGTAGEDLFHTILDALPSPVFVVDANVAVVAANEAGRELTAAGPGILLHGRSGAALSCVYVTDSADGCSSATHCPNCIIRNAVKASIEGHRTVRSRHSVDRRHPDGHRERLELLVTAAPVHVMGSDLTLLVLEDVTELTELRSLLPICAYCKKIRTDGRMWEQLESYMRRHHEVDFSHGICPECLAKQMCEIEAARAKRGGTDPSSH